MSDSKRRKVELDEGISSESSNKLRLNDESAKLNHCSSLIVHNIAQGVGTANPEVIAARELLPGALVRALSNYVPTEFNPRTKKELLAMLVSPESRNLRKTMKVHDYYENVRYWQEYDCPSCLQDFDVSPIPRPGMVIVCSCGSSWKAGECAPNTYVIDPEGSCVVVNYPQP